MTSSRDDFEIRATASQACNILAIVRQLGGDPMPCGLYCKQRDDDSTMNLVVSGRIGGNETAEWDFLSVPEWLMDDTCQVSGVQDHANRVLIDAHVIFMPR